MVKLLLRAVAPMDEPGGLEEDLLAAETSPRTVLPVYEPEELDEDLPAVEVPPRAVVPVAELEEPKEDLPAVNEPEEDLQAVEALPRAVAPMEEPGELEEDLQAMEVTGEPEWPRAILRTKLQQPGGWLQTTVAVLAVLGLVRLDKAVIGFVDNDCSYSTNRVDAYSLLEQMRAPPQSTTMRWRGPFFAKLCR